MGVIVGLDIGGSTTKIVGFHADRMLVPTKVKASNPVASAYGGLGSFLEHNALSIGDLEEIRVTGVGASFVRGLLLDRPTRTVAEFDSVGRGGLFLSHRPAAIVVSMGTGTSIVSANEREVRHIIGSGVGGGTLAGLSSRLLNVHDIDTITTLAARGDLSHIDLSVGDLTRDPIPGLEPDTTASNFGKRYDLATPEDIALGLVNVIFQSVATTAVMAARLAAVHDIVFTGYVAVIPEGADILDRFAALYDLAFLVPEHAEYATAVGAALSAP